MKKRSRSVLAFLLLLLFCSMTGIKAFHHHHHCEGTEHEICPLDGISMDCPTHSHTLMYEWEEDEACDCPICQFSVVKVIITPHLFYGLEANELQIHRCLSEPSYIFHNYGLNLLRAPPVKF